MVRREGVVGVGRGTTGGLAGEGGREGTGAEGGESVLVQTANQKCSLLLYRLPNKWTWLINNCKSRKLSATSAL